VVLARCSGQADPVCGTVLFGRMHAGGGRPGLGLFINTLPIRIRTECQKCGAERPPDASGAGRIITARACLTRLGQRLQRRLRAGALVHALVQLPHKPLSDPNAPRPRAFEGISYLRGESAPLSVTLSVDDWGRAFSLKAQTDRTGGAERVCALNDRALEQLVEALEREPDRLVERLEYLCPVGRKANKLLVEWNGDRGGLPGQAHAREPRPVAPTRGSSARTRAPAATGAIV